MMEPDATSSVCAGCGQDLPRGVLCCPKCHTLTHAVQLKALAQQAGAAQAAQDLAGALAAWRQAAQLLPVETAQHRTVIETINTLSHAVTAGVAPGAPSAAPPKPKARGVWAAGVAAVVLVLSKFKLVGTLLLTQGKFLLLGLGKLSTFSSMLLAFGVYWAAWGWPFALGLVVTTYVHEMGHVYALTRYGIPASAPMFIPGVGAFVRLKGRLANPVEDARVGLAGPWWGLAATAAVWGAWWLTQVAALAGIAQTSAWINVFNLLPLGSLDGGRGFQSLKKEERVWCAAMALLAWAFLKEGMLLLIALMALWQAFRKPAYAPGDFRGAAAYVVLLTTLAALSQIPVLTP